jgi:hypothetical protein
VPPVAREDLYSEIWAEPLETVATRYGISVAALAKTAKSMEIPIPSRGYRARKAAGRSPKQTPLPPRQPGAADTTDFGRPTSTVTDAWAELSEPAPEAPTFNESLGAVLKRVQSVMTPVASRPISRPHPLVQKLLAKDERLQKGREESSFPQGMPLPVFEGRAQRRRLKIVNSIFVAMEDLGAKPSVRSGRDPFILKVGVARVYFTIECTSEQHLKLKIDVPPGLEFPCATTWQDEADTPMEDHLSELAVALLVAGESVYRAQRMDAHRLALERRARLQARVDAQAAETERQSIQAEKDSLEARRGALFAQLRDWRAANDIRGFVSELSTRSATTEVFEQWSKWALSVADEIDPTVQFTSLGLG